MDADRWRTLALANQLPRTWSAPRVVRTPSAMTNAKVREQRRNDRVLSGRRTLPRDLALNIN